MPISGPPGTGKSHLAQAIGRAAIQQGYRVTYREAHTLLEEIAEAAVDGTRKALLTELATVPLLIIDDLGISESRVAGPSHCLSTSPPSSVPRPAADRRLP